MTLTSVRPGDIVEIDKRGRRFLAHVAEKQQGGLKITPLKGENVSYYEASAREVVGHWRKTFPR